MRGESQAVEINIADMSERIHSSHIVSLDHRKCSNTTASLQQICEHETAYFRIFKGVRDGIHARAGDDKITEIRHREAAEHVFEPRDASRCGYTSAAHNSGSSPSSAPTTMPDTITAVENARFEGGEGWCSVAGREKDADGR
uniref:Uncharacterized protein n=1 Tax=Oryza brachyantha TaxID=4533 RepID=J3LBW1_ORYBR